MEAVLLALQRAFPVMLRMSLSAAVLTGVVVLLRVLLRKAPKRVLCLLWLLVAVRLLCPALPRSGASLMPPGGTAAVSDRQIVSAVDAALPVLEPGTYWVTLGACRNGKYISEQERYEKTGYNCIFALIIPG